MSTSHWARVRIGAAPTSVNSTLGGMPSLPADIARPRCRLCGELLTAFFQTEIPDGLGGPFEPGSRLSVFACPTHDDIPGHIYTDGKLEPPPGQLPDRFWEDNDGHYAAFLVKPSAETISHPSDGRIMPVALALEVVDEEPEPELEFKLGGAPAFLQDAVEYRCCCGAPMALVCQLPPDLEIPIEPDAPRQPNGYADDTYVLFLGNATYLFACTRQCDPRAVLAVVQG